MTGVRDRPTVTDALSTANAPWWRPYVDDPVMTPAMALSWDATSPIDLQRLARYLSALVAARRAPVHVSKASSVSHETSDLRKRPETGQRG